MPFKLRYIGQRKQLALPLAVNAGSALTPIGNPQNLYLWQRSGLGFHEFIGAMLPLCLILLLPLLALTVTVFSSKAVTIKAAALLPPKRTRLLQVSLALYAPFLLLTNLHLAPVATALILLFFCLSYREVLARLDWGLLLVFMLMFIDLRLIAGLDRIHELLDYFNLADPRHLYLVGLAASQLISNVPAAILLSTYTPDWRLIAYAVNTGGYGLLMGSLANLIALRLLGERRAWLSFHFYSIPYLTLAGLLVYCYLFLAH